MGTSPEEIERQRKEAFRLIENGLLQFSPNINHGEIPLMYKKHPVPELINNYKVERNMKNDNEKVRNNGCYTVDDTSDNNSVSVFNASTSDEVNEEKKISEGDLAQMNVPTKMTVDDEQQIAIEFQQETSFFPCWSSRGYADISMLQDLVREGYNLKYTKNTSTTKSIKQTSPTKTKQKQQPTVTASTMTNTSIKNRIQYTANDIQSITNLWDPVNAAINNVSICRPSHDAWGIGKIILIFCDDFLQSIYELPWLQDMQEAIQPILDVLNVPINRVVRMLLASLPPGGTIPIHTDSGEWVQHTHRVHCPILVQDETKIVFQCGLTSQTLCNIQCNPGHVFEINNQAYHFVSNATSDHRVHLILDYVDQIPIQPRIKLQPSEIVVQTRRSIDRLVDAGKRCTPTYFILGAQKAGTTTLYEALVQHPLVINAKRRETHCFDWRWNDTIMSIDELRQYIQTNFYYASELHYHPACLTGDSTPSYLIDSKRVIPRLRAICHNWLDQLRFFIMIREPIQRLESHYAMVTSPAGTPEQLKTRGYEWRNNKTIDDIIKDDIKNMKDCGLLPYWNIDLACTPGKEFDRILFDRFSGSVEEDKAWELYLSKYVPLNTGSYGIVSRGLYELNIRPWLRSFSAAATAPKSMIPESSQKQQVQQQQKQFCIIRLEDIKNDGIQTTMNELVWDHLGLPVTTITDTTPKNVREYTSILNNSTKQYMQRFYQPHNERLVAMIETYATAVKHHVKHFEQWKRNGTCWIYDN